jgi:toxin ParE1/3/4
VGDGRRVVFWTRAARDSLDEILTFIALDSPALASKVAEVVLGAAESLSLFAERGRLVPETGTSMIREIFVYRYRLMYQVLNAEVRVLTVLHGAMDFEGWLQRQR